MYANLNILETCASLSQEYEALLVCTYLLRLSSALFFNAHDTLTKRLKQNEIKTEQTERAVMLQSR